MLARLRRFPPKTLKADLSAGLAAALAAIPEYDSFAATRRALHAADKH